MFHSSQIDNNSSGIYIFLADMITNNNFDHPKIISTKVFSQAKLFWIWQNFYFTSFAGLLLISHNSAPLAYWGWLFVLAWTHGWLMLNQKEINQLVAKTIMWLWPLTIHMAFTINLQAKFWNSLISRMGGLIGMKQKGCESIIHDNDVDLLVTKVRCWDLLDSDWVTSDVGVLSSHLVD